MNNNPEAERLLLLSRIAGLEAEVESLRAALSGAAMPAEQAAQAKGATAAFDAMTMKQRATAIALIEGRSFASIADAMGADETTIKLHAKAAYAKLGVPGKARLTEIAEKIKAELLQSDLELRWGVGFGWMDTRNPALMAELAKRKATLPPAAPRKV